MSDKTRSPEPGSSATGSSATGTSVSSGSASSGSASSGSASSGSAVLGIDTETSRFNNRGCLHVIVSAALLVAIVIMSQYLAFRHYRRFDWTSDGIYTLSERSLQIVRGLEQSVDIYLVLSSGEPNYQDIREMLERYRAANQQIAVHYVDPSREPAEYALIAQRFQLGMSAPEPSAFDVAVVLESGERTWKIRGNDLVHVDFSDMEDGGEPKVDAQTEAALTGGLLEITQGEPTRVCVTEGHGEWTLDRAAQRDIGALRDEMRSENLAIDSIDTRGGRELPDDCDAVFVVGPTLPFTDEESQQIASYLRHGGNLFVAADPEMRNGVIVPTGLEEMLRDFGIRLDRTLVLEFAREASIAGANPLGPFLAGGWSDHPIVRGYRALTGATVVVDMVRSVRPVNERATTLVSTSETSFAETDIAALIQGEEPSRDPDDVQGPVSIAVATRVEVDGELALNPDAEGEERRADEARGGRIVVIGDVDWLSGEFLGPGPMNLPLANAIIGWLTARDALIELPPRHAANEEREPLTTASVNELFFQVVILLPLAIAFLGFAAWWNRRS